MPIVGAVVFDFDGTLVDSNHIKREAYDAAFQLIPGARSHIAKALAGHPGKDRHFIIGRVVTSLSRGGALKRGDAAQVKRRALRAYSSYCRTGVALARDFRGVSSTLRALANRYRVAVNSATPERQLRQLVRARPWGAYCELVVGSPATKVTNLERIARRFKLRPSDMMLVGDSRVDLEAAARFGCGFLHAKHLRSSTGPKILRRITTELNRRSRDRD